jgi:hypothetical protein
MGYSVAKGQAGPPPAPQEPQAAATGFTYQGSLKQAGSAVNGNCDFQFGLWNAQSLGVQVGITQTLTSQSVDNGLFSVKLNGGSEFGAAPFDGSPRWLATAVRCPAGTGSYSSLTPQELNAVPYALGAPWSGISGKPSNTLIVAKSGGDFNTITEALNSISGASDANRYLVKVMPGVYTETVTMKAYVDLEGSGELVTKITYSGSASNTTGTLIAADNAEVRFLTVANTGGNTYAIAIYITAPWPRLTSLTATASGGTNNYGVLDNAGAVARMTNVTATAIGGTNSYGVYNGNGGTAMMKNVNASAYNATNNYGVYNNMAGSIIQYSLIAATGGTNNYGIYNTSNCCMIIVKVDQSQVIGITNTIYSDSHFNMRVGATLLNGGAVSNAGTLTCVGVYSGNYVALNGTCQ